MIFRQLFDKDSSTYTYLLADPKTSQGLIIDPVKHCFERDRALIQRLNIQLKFVLETHIHADHITAAHLFREKMHCKIAFGKKAAAKCADLMLQDGEVIRLNSIKVKVIATPGHTACSVCYFVNDQYLFSGDTLLIGGCGRTDFQGGSANALYESIIQKLFTLADATQVFPAHDYNGFMQTTIGEEKCFNPRLANKSKTEFVKLMHQLNLPEPKLINIAVPANQGCGR